MRTQIVPDRRSMHGVQAASQVAKEISRMEPEKAGAAALIGHVLGGIELEQVLGTGATGAVYLGKQSTAGHEQVAVKVLMLPMQLSESQRTEFRQRFHREAGLLQLLRHPGILPV